MASVRHTEVYLNDGSGCEKCNFTGRFGGWLGDKWCGYPQISCSHCKPSEYKKPKEVAQ